MEIYEKTGVVPKCWGGGGVDEEVGCDIRVREADLLSSQ